MAYSLNPSSDNCYEGTTCLVNKLGIRDEKRLSEVEAQITFAKAVMLEETPIDDDSPFQRRKRQNSEDLLHTVDQALRL